MFYVVRYVIPRDRKGKAEMETCELQQNIRSTVSCTKRLMRGKKGVVN